MVDGQWLTFGGAAPPGMAASQVNEQCAHESLLRIQEHWEFCSIFASQIWPWSSQITLVTASAPNDQRHEASQS